MAHQRWLLRRGPVETRPLWEPELVSFTSHCDDGRCIEPWPNAVGRTAYDADGHVIGLLISGRRNEADGRSSPQEAREEFSAVLRDIQCRYRARGHRPRRLGVAERNAGVEGDTTKF